MPTLLRNPVLLAALLWLTLLAAILAVPHLAHSPTLGEDLTRNTVRLSLLYYVAAAFLMLRLSPDDWAAGSTRGRLARACWTLAWAAFVVHVGTALHFYDHWSHAHAVARTHERTGFGEGVYISHLFTILWTADVAYWWLRPAGYAARRPWIDAALHALMVLIVFNGTVVFEDGPIRWAGAAGFAGLAAAWLGRRRGGERRG